MTEYASRLARVQAAMADRSMAALVVSDPANIYYLCGYDAWSFSMPQCLIVPAAGEPQLFARAIDAAGAASISALRPDQVQSGTGTSIVAAECVVSCDRRLLPSEDAGSVLEQVRQRIAALGLGSRGLGVDVRMPMAMPGFETPADHPFVVVADGAVQAAGGPRLPLGGWSAACDGGFIARDAGVPVVVLGPGSVVAQAHRADESVGIDELLVAARTYALLALRLLG